MVELESCLLTGLKKKREEEGRGGRVHQLEAGTQGYYLLQPLGRYASWRACLRLGASRPVFRLCRFVLETWQVLPADRQGCMRLGPPALCPVLLAGRLASDLGYQTRVQYCQRAGFTSRLGHEACILCCQWAPCEACIQCCRLAWALEVYPVPPAGLDVPGACIPCCQWVSWRASRHVLPAGRLT